MGEAETKSVRVTLTAAQMATPEGAALLSLCQRVTADGEITDPEVEEIRGWLKANESAGVVGTAFLDKTITRHMADGSLDPYERQELQEALERIMPKKHREAAIAARRAVELRRFKEAPEPVAEEAEDDDGGDVFDFMLAGVGYEGRAFIVEEYVHPDDCAHLWRDKGNRFSPNAIAVRTGSGLMIGYVPEWHASHMAPLLDQGYTWRAYVKKVLAGYRGPTPVVVAMLSPPGVKAAGDGEPCCKSSIALLRASNPQTSDEAASVVSAFLARSTEETRLEGTPTLDHLERMASYALDLRPTVRELLARSEAARPLEGTFETLIQAVDNMAGSVRAALGAIQATAPKKEDRARAERLLENLGATPAPPVPQKVEKAPPAPRAATSTTAKGPADNTKWMILGLGLVVAIALAFVIIGSR